MVVVNGIYRHVKSGELYAVWGSAKRQTEPHGGQSPIGAHEVVVYVNMTGEAASWFLSIEEFEDGRFELVADWG